MGYFIAILSLSCLILDCSQLLFLKISHSHLSIRGKRAWRSYYWMSGAPIKSRCLCCHVLFWGFKWKSEGTISEWITVQLHEVWTLCSLFHCLLVPGDRGTQKVALFKDVAAGRSVSGKEWTLYCTMTCGFEPRYFPIHVFFTFKALIKCRVLNTQFSFANTKRNMTSIR